MLGARASLPTCLRSLPRESGRTGVLDLARRDTHPAGELGRPLWHHVVDGGDHDVAQDDAALLEFDDELEAVVAVVGEEVCGSVVLLDKSETSAVADRERWRHQLLSSAPPGHSW